MTRAKQRARVIGVHPCDETAQVVTVKTDAGRHIVRREPCQECPWRKDSPIGAFPVEAYRHSAGTCADMATTTFACHMSGAEKPATCAGFLLSEDAQHNMLVRLAMMRGDFKMGDISPTVPTYRRYRDMATANGVDEDDPALARLRPAPARARRG